MLKMIARETKSMIVTRNSRGMSSLGCGPLTYNTARFNHVCVLGNRTEIFLEVPTKILFGIDIGRCSCSCADEAAEGIDDGRPGSNRSCSKLGFLTSRFCSIKDGGEVDELADDRFCMYSGKEGKS